MEVVPPEQPGLEASEYEQHGQNIYYVPQKVHVTGPESYHFPPEQGIKTAPKEKRSVLVIAISVALTAAIIGTAVGGGLGASLSNCQSNLGYV